MHGFPGSLSGPPILTLFPVVFVATLVVMAVVPPALTRIGSRQGAEDVRLDAYQAAYLAGGRRRLVDTAIASLAMHDHLLVSRRGQLTPAGHVSVHRPVELAVYRAVHTTSSRGAVHRRVHNDPALRAIEEQVRLRGLLLAGTHALLWWLTRLLPVAVAAVGLVLALTGYRSHRQASDLTIMLVAFALPLFWVMLGRLEPYRRPTPLGRAVLRRLETRYRVNDTEHKKHLERERKHGREIEPWDPVAAVGVLGFIAIPSPTLRDALFRSRGPTTGGDQGA